MSEQDIQRKIKKDLEARGWYVTKVKPGIYGAPVGHSDLIVSAFANWPGVTQLPICVYVEVKTRTGKTSMMQDIWIRERLKESHLVCVARCTQDVIDYLLEEGLEV